ncbi:MAG: fibrobacter succinogenes major paralogous domain-containing protein [Flavobacterium sp.]|uniref:fibrobacter succinogenes major paralogous domain-containing protein n=1 Tax=Flavobacterium sp. TaxID=239 RepID=UPI0022C71676|nr:fibrobacter succinogenes major paralogous domain-containing protein [Flavobacterium sp.]MCZ8297022.1 fibrobacter succinogenes major paralogous domain-containing protein [Flavobacterium sp.]
MKNFLIVTFISLFLVSCSTSENNSGANASEVLRVETYSVTNITFTGARCFSTVTSGLSLLQEIGVCWSTSPNPTISGAHVVGVLNPYTGAYYSDISSLTLNTNYFLRTYAKDTEGNVTYSQQTSFTTLNLISSAGSGVTDIDGKSYPTVLINGKEWMKENLSVTKYRNGDVIPQVTDINQWDNLTTGAWCYYENNSANGTTYGKLYNWYAVNDPRGLAPNGWHVPTAAEWAALSTFLGGDSVAGIKIKDDSGTYWEVTTAFSNNQSGFTALPAGTGYLNYHTLASPTLADVFKNQTRSAYWWTSTSNGDLAYSREVHSTSLGLSNSGLLKKSALSVRCVKN